MTALSVKFFIKQALSVNYIYQPTKHAKMKNKKRLFIAAALVLAASATCSAKNVVPVHTSCGKTAYIDTNRGTLEEVMQQAMAINDVLCP